MTGPIRFRSPKAAGTEDVTTTASTLITLGTTIENGIGRLTIQNIDAAKDITIQWNAAPTAGVGHVLRPYEVMIFEWERTDIIKLQFITSAGTAKMQVWQEGMM